MTFPATTILDDFNRANAGPPPSASWDEFGVDGVKVVSNTCAADAAGSTGKWLTQFGPNCEVYCTISTLQADGNTIGLFLRADATASTGYVLSISRDDAGGDLVTLSGPSGDIDSSSVTLVAGDAFGVEAVGDVFNIYQKPAAGAWTLVLSTSDSGVAGSGYIGIALGDTTARIDDFGGGELSIPASPVIASPITGLYGTTYSIWLLSPTGTFIKLIARFNRLSYTLAANGIGVCKLTLPPTFPFSFVQEDSRLLIWRQVPGGRKYLDGDAVWLIRDWEESINQQGKQEYTLLAYTASEILDRAIIAYSQGSSQGSKASQPLDNIIKALVRENLGSLATDTARDISAYLVVEADLSLGPSAPKTAPWRKLLPTLRELAQTADDLGTRIFFDVVHGSPLLLRTFKDQRGINHGLTSGQRVILSTRNGTIAQISRSHKSSDERNVIYLGGSSTQIDATRTGASPINRREFFLDAGNMIAAQLTAEGQAALRNYRPKESYSIKIRDTTGIRYGREYGFGDRLAAEVGNQLKEVRLDAVEVVVEGGRETINGDLRVDE